MKNIIILISAVLISSLTYASEPVHKDKKSPLPGTYNLTAVMGTIKKIESKDPRVTAFQCNYPYNVVCLYKATIDIGPVVIDCAPSTLSQYTTSELDPDKTYLGIPFGGTLINFYPIDNMSITCIDDGVQIEVSPAIGVIPN